MKFILKIVKNIIFILENIYFILKYAFKNKEFFLLSLKISLIFVFDHFRKILIIKKFKKEKNSFKNSIKNYHFSNDWFTENIPSWLSIYNSLRLNNKKLRCLEIGSYEGMSTLFMIKSFNIFTIDCVETFDGSDEHSHINFSKVEQNFIDNLESYKDKYFLHKMTSDNFFKTIVKDKMYDFIYIDGSHFSDQVFKDAENSFKCLEKGGIIVFDDFLKKYYLNIKENTIGGVIPFIKKNQNNLKIKNIGYQLCIQKIT